MVESHTTILLAIYKDPSFAELSPYMVFMDFTDHNDGSNYPPFSPEGGENILSGESVCLEAPRDRNYRCGSLLLCWQRGDVAQSYSRLVRSEYRFMLQGSSDDTATSLGPKWFLLFLNSILGVWVLCQKSQSLPTPNLPFGSQHTGWSVHTDMFALLYGIVLANS